MGQCNLNIGARKVGAAMKRLPQLYYGDKVKEQILQKWDPVSKRMVNIHDNAPIITMLNEWNLNYNIFTALWSQSKGSSVELQIFTNSTNSIEGATPVLSAVFLAGTENTNTYVTNYTSVFRNFYFFTIRPINCIVSPTRSPVYQLNWYVNGWVPTSLNMVFPLSVAIDDVGNTYTSDNNGKRIIKTTSSGVSTLLLTLAYSQTGVYVKSNILYIVRGDSEVLGNNIVTRYNLSTGAYIEPPFTVETFGARGLIMDSQNNMYIHVGSGSIRKRTPDGTNTGILSNTGSPCGASMGYYRDSLNDEYIYYAESTNHVINRTLVLRNGVVPATFVKELVAGTLNVSSYSGDGGPALQAKLQAPRGVNVDTLGNVIIADTESNAIRYIPVSTGIIHTICGGIGYGPATNGVVGTSSQVKKPWGVLFKDPSTVYFTDNENNVTRVLNLTGHY
jgi:hypothetical protein